MKQRFHELPESFRDFGKSQDTQHTLYIPHTTNMRQYEIHPLIEGLLRLTITRILMRMRSRHPSSTTQSWKNNCRIATLRAAQLRLTTQDATENRGSVPEKEKVCYQQRHRESGKQEIDRKLPAPVMAGLYACATTQSWRTREREWFRVS